MIIYPKATLIKDTNISLFQRKYSGDISSPSAQGQGYPPMNSINVVSLEKHIQNEIWYKIY